MFTKLLFRSLVYCALIVMVTGFVTKGYGMAWAQIADDDAMAALRDRAAISDQVARYAQLWDRKDAEAFSRLFTEDGKLEWVLGGGRPKPPIVSGRAAIFEYAIGAHEGRLADRQSRHHFSSLVFDHLSTEQAVTEHIFVVTHQLANNEPIVKSTGIYRIQWRKTQEGWLMSHRTLKVDR